MGSGADAGSTPGAESRLGAEAVILMYHHCAPLPAGAAIRGLYVSPRQFAWQLDWLMRRGVRFCTLAELAAGAAGDGPPRVVLTFDDGLRDVYENAWPLLAARRIPAVVFPVVGDIGRSGVVWAENKDRSPKNLMTEEQIREMAAGGIEFGSHLWEHRHATRLAPGDLADQLARSRERLRAVVGREIVSIAYPYGDYSPAVVDATARAGYRIAVTIEPGSNRGAPLLALRRLNVKGSRWHHPLRFRRDVGQALAAAAP